MNIIKNLKLWKRFINAQLMHDFAYRNQFFIFLISRFVFSMAGPILAIVIYGLGNGIPGWTFHEFLLFNGTLTLFSGVAWTFFMVQTFRVPREIELGNFDRFLLRPVNSVKYFLFSGFDLDGIGNIIMGLLIITYAVIAGHIQITILSVMVFFYILLLGWIVDFCCMLVVIVLSLLFVKSEVVWNIIDTFFDVSAYPINIYASFVQFIFTFVLPFALASFYPAQALLGKLNLWMLVPITLAVIIFASVVTAIFNLAIRKYTSAGG